MFGRRYRRPLWASTGRYVRPGYHFYTTIYDPERKRAGWLLGPYGTLGIARRQIERARVLARGQDPWSDFYAFGVMAAMQDIPIRTVFGR